jgi:hypothetical protein
MRNANHVTDHNELRELVSAELARFGMGNTLGGPWQPGDPDHVGRHNSMVDALAALASTAGQTYTTPLPPHRALGASGHLGDHDVMRAAAVQAATWDAFNVASGGNALADFADSEGIWAVRVFTASSTFTVTKSVRPFEIILQAGGGAGAGGSQHGGGGGGHYTATDLMLPIGGTSFTVGQGGASNLPGNPTRIEGHREALGGQEGRVGGGAGGTPNGGNGGAGPTSPGGTPGVPSAGVILPAWTGAYAGQGQAGGGGAGQWLGAGPTNGVNGGGNGGTDGQPGGAAGAEMGGGGGGNGSSNGTGGHGGSGSIFIRWRKG